MDIFESRHVYAGGTLWRREPEGADAVAAKFARSRDRRLSLRGDEEALCGLLERFADAIEANGEELALMISEEVGRLIGECRAEIAKSVKLIRYYGLEAGKWLEDRPVKTQAGSSRVAFEPLGEVLAVMPWNYPVWQPLRFAIPAIRAGNGALVKPAPGVGRVTERLLSLVPEDLPLDVLWLAHEDVERAVESSDGLAFTGSVATGSLLASMAGRHLKKSVMELGGSNPFIVLADADIERAAESACYSRFRDAGQSCNAAKRIIVEESVADRFLEAFLAKVAELVPGDPAGDATLAALHPLDAPMKMAGFVEDALDRGARLLAGGRAPGGPFYEATVLDGVPSDARLAKEEVFGPVAPVFRVRDPEEALRLANDSPYGLGATIFSEDLEAAEKMALRLETGGVYVNRHTSSDLSLPFGGVKKSGYGRELADFGLREFVNVKTYWRR